MPTGPRGQKRKADVIGNAVRDMDWIVGMIDAVAAKPNPPARYKLATGTTDTLNQGVTLAMADARKPRG